MEYSQAINMAITAVTMDMILDKEMKKQIIETLSEIDEKICDYEENNEK